MKVAIGRPEGLRLDRERRLTRGQNPTEPRGCRLLELHRRMPEAGLLALDERIGLATLVAEF